MKVVSYISACALLLSLAACTKDNPDERAAIENTLPAIEMTSMGLPTQVGPFATSDVIQVSVGGAITKETMGDFAVAWYDGNTLADSTHFASWTEKAGSTNGGNSIATSLVPTTYPNTFSFASTLILKLANLKSGKSYTLKAYATTGDNKAATLSVSKLVTMK